MRSRGSCPINASLTNPRKLAYWLRTALRRLSRSRTGNTVSLITALTTSPSITSVMRATAESNTLPGCVVMTGNAMIAAV
ncbi:hypothetical protein D3C87_2051300 [compost metagenome]